MKKRVLVDIAIYDKIIAWVSDDKKLKIVGFVTVADAQEWIHNQILLCFKCSFGIYNGCNAEIINRILKAEEIL